MRCAAWRNFGSGCKKACRTYVLSGAILSLGLVRLREHKSKRFSQRVLGAVDLAIDFATLGEYGLETWPEETGCLADGSCRERRGHTTAREALATTRPRGRDAHGARSRRATTKSRPEGRLFR
jgi:hypothetical protein